MPFHKQYLIGSFFMYGSALAPNFIVFKKVIGLKQWSVQVVQLQGANSATAAWRSPDAFLAV